MSQSGFWDNSELAQPIVTELNGLKKILGDYHQVQKQLDDALALSELLQNADDADSQNELSELLSRITFQLDQLEISTFLNGPYDAKNAIVSLHPGAGGTESCDWADMLLRMYRRWAERRGYGFELDDIQPGEEAGISSATFRLIGPMAYGYAKAERGVHRLVRISPFDSNARRHTSFCAVDVIAEVEDAPIQINEEDLEIHVARASGPGGQGVNTTDSAVQIFHKPSGIRVRCIDERSQLKNKNKALKILRARLFEYEQDKKRTAMEKFYGEKGEIGFGAQIRSYVLQPYQLVKDLRTGAQTANASQVLDGEIDIFINSWLKAGCPRSRQSADSDNEN